MYPDVFLAILAGSEPNEHLKRWAGQLDDWMAFAGSKTWQGIPEARNDICRFFLARRAQRWLLMMDHDMVPLPGTQELLDSRAPVASARAWAKSGREAHPHTISAACLKVHRDALERIRDPWFRFAPHSCECSCFFQRAYRAGYRPETVGIVGHRFPIVVIPGEGNAVFRFDSEIRRGQV